MISAQIVGPVEIEHVEKVEDLRDYRVSFEKIEHTLGFGITRTVEDGIREILEAIDHGVLSDFENPAYRN